MKFQKSYLFLIILAILSISGCSSQSESTIQWQLAKRTHTVANNDHLKLLWKRPIYTLADDFGNQCTAMEGSVFAVGSETSTGSVSLMAFNGKDGKLRWSKETGFYLTSSETQLFISKGQTVTSFSPSNGDVLWSTYIPQARALGIISYLDHKLWNIDDSISNAISIRNILFYISTKDLLKAVNIESGEVIFETSIQPSIEFFNLDKMVQHDGYYLCADEQKEQLYMILGDSRQMFAFSVIE